MFFYSSSRYKSLLELLKLLISNRTQDIDLNTYNFLRLKLEHKAEKLYICPNETHEFGVFNSSSSFKSHLEQLKLFNCNKTMYFAVYRQFPYFQMGV